MKSAIKQIKRKSADATPLASAGGSDPVAEQLEQKALRRFHREEEFKPYQAELIRMQHHLEENRRRMIILFEGRSAAGKGGTIRRVTRYMNEKHYRVVALAKPTAQEKTQWFYQRYIRQFPRGGEIVLFDRSWYTRAIVEPVFGQMKHVRGFRQFLVRGLKKVRGEWNLLCLTHNLLKIWRHTCALT